jgi:TPR repeat protein
MINGNGMGVQKNPVQAARWFAKGRELDLPYPR